MNSMMEAQSSCAVLITSVNIVEVDVNKYVHFCKAGVGLTAEIMKHVAEEIAAPPGRRS